MKGIDVYVGQGKIDWRAVSKGGYEFAMIKATQGRGEGALTKLLQRFTDSNFKKNITEASSAGLAVGVYHYMTADSVEKAREEALYFCSVIAPYRDKITLWAAVDVESSMYLGALGRYELAKIVREFMLTVKANGFRAMLYTNPNFLTYKLPQGEFDRDEIWLAHYGVSTPKKVPNTRIWQYGKGSVPGVKTECDLNEGYFSPAFPAISRLYAKGVINSPLYWSEHFEDISFLAELIIKAEGKITEAGAPCRTVAEALTRLNSAGVINTPEYWQNNAERVKFLPELIMKLGGSV